MTPIEPTQIPELAAIIRSGHLSRCRLLDIVCPNQHRLAQVITVPGHGRLILAQQRTVDMDDERTRARHHGRQNVYPVDGGIGRWSLDVYCACRQTSIHRDWVVGQIADGQRRVVYDVIRTRVVGEVDQGRIDAIVRSGRQPKIMKDPALDG